MHNAEGMIRGRQGMRNFVSDMYKAIGEQIMNLNPSYKLQEAARRHPLPPVCLELFVTDLMTDMR